MKNALQRRNWISRMHLPAAGAALALAAVLASVGVTTQSAQAQTLTTLRSFDGANGSSPRAGLVQAINGNFYGTTADGGTYGDGTVFKITPSGTLTTLHSFDDTDGETPEAGLVQATNGNFYGTTYGGGTYGSGTIFEITPSGTLATLHSFCSQGAPCTDGAYPLAGLIQGSSGDLYGTTYEGGANGDGAVFKITPSGTLTALYSFCSQSACADGFSPSAGLVQGTNGDFYGTAQEGGANGYYGTVFRITPSGTLTTLHSFDGVDGSTPYAGLVQATNGDFYGTTQIGGANLEGTVFKITPGGTLTTLYSFCSKSACTDGEEPIAGLAQATDGNFYGTTSLGGAANTNCIENECGTLFKITPSGTLTTLQFDDTDGATPEATLIQDTNGKLYGITELGGASNAGTVFSLSVGLGQFVETLPASGKVGAAIKILGTSLTGATAVTFNGTAAVFTVVSSSEIATTVPASATSGSVQVVTSSGTLSSNVNFRVTP